MVKKKKTSRKKVFVAVAMFSVFMITSIISVVLVLANTNQAARSNISISYVSDGVAAKVKANYAILPEDDDAEVEIKYMTDGYDEEVSFDVTDIDEPRQLMVDEEGGDILLNSQQQEVVFEYYFENISDNPFSIKLTESPDGDNITKSYYVSAEPLSLSQYKARVNNPELATQSMIEFGDKIYIYASIKVANASRQAYCEGQYAWFLQKQDVSNVLTVYLDNEGLLSSAKAIKDCAIRPLIEIPASTEENNIFTGFYAQENSEGKKYINESGFGCEEITSDITELYAGYTTNQAQFFDLSLDETVVKAVSNVGRNAEELVVPDSVTTISEEAFYGASSLVKISIPASVTIIGDSAFENSENLETVEFLDETGAVSYSTDALTKIGANVFRGCAKLKNINLPDTIERIEKKAFAGCSSLETIEIPTTIKFIGEAAFKDCESLDEVVVPSAIAGILGDNGKLTNSVGGNILDMQISGNSKQEKYAGKNMLNLSAGVSGSASEIATINGTTITIPYSSGNSISSCANQKILVEPGETYTISFELVQGSARLGFRLYDINNSLINNSSITISGWNYNQYYMGYYKDTNTASFIVPNNVFNVEILFFAMNYNSSSTSIYRNYQFEKGTKATEYEEYVGILSTENPQEIVSVGERTKNLLDIKNRTFATLSSAGPNTEKRTFEFDKYYVGLTMNNYYYPYNISKYSVNGDIVAVQAVSSGYGVGFPIKTVPNKQYTLSKAEGSDLGVGFYTSDGVYIENSMTSTFTTPANCEVMVIIFRPTSGAEYVYKNVQLEEGSTATEYEPYGYRVPITVTGKNLLDIKDSTVSGTVSWTAKLLGDYELESGTYTISAKYRQVGEQESTISLSIREYGNLSVYYTTIDSKLTSGYFTKTFTVPKGSKGIRIYIYSNQTATAMNTSCEFSEIQIEKGSEATEYEQYTGSTHYVYMDEPLRKIGDYADYIDFKTGKVVRKVLSIAFTGKENHKDQTGIWNKFANSSTGNSAGYYFSNDYSLGIYKAEWITRYAMCNMFIVKEFTNMHTQDDSVYGYMCIHELASPPYISFKHDDMTIDQWKNYLSELYNNGTPLIVNIALKPGCENEEIVDIPTISLPEGTAVVRVGNSTLNASDIKVNYLVSVDPSVFD